MIKHIELTKDHVKLLHFLYWQIDGDNKIFVDRTHLFNLGSHLLEDMAMILGMQDTAIKGTEESPDGRAFPEEIEEYLLGLHKYIADNLYYILSLITTFQGNLTEGKYKCKDNDLIWTKE
jgi:hypothetical protein|nr:MAG TPA: hypothetical protein [Caudoviricetes sp.]